MTVKDFLGLVYESTVCIFEKGKTFAGCVCEIHPDSDDNWKEYDKYFNRVIVQVEAIPADNNDDAEIYLVVE